jgi:hypothetical protein
MLGHARPMGDVSVSGGGLDPTLNTPRTIKFWFVLEISLNRNVIIPSQLFYQEKQSYHSHSYRLVLV